MRIQDAAISGDVNKPKVLAKMFMGTFTLEQVTLPPESIQQVKAMLNTNGSAGAQEAKKLEACRTIVEFCRQNRNR